MSTILAIVGRNKQTIPGWSYILVVLLCTLSVFRPDFEWVKEGRILNKIKRLQMICTWNSVINKKYNLSGQRRSG
jgi:hypothetical protein